ncbi:hypothetical protein K7432_011261 [Basidiobolus ranarum]|uniref:Uncharacterized protein n=1 Tax=Basidiobolus ranarum TaxID=34480 RepID=A0ABR2VU98_9FUNG
MFNPIDHKKSRPRRPSLSESLTLPETGGDSLSYVETVQPEISHQLPPSSLPHFVQESKPLLVQHDMPTQTDISESDNNTPKKTSLINL